MLNTVYGSDTTAVNTDFFNSIPIILILKFKLKFGRPKNGNVNNKRCSIYKLVKQTTFYIPFAFCEALLNCNNFNTLLKQILHSSLWTLIADPWFELKRMPCFVNHFISS